MFVGDNKQYPINVFTASLTDQDVKALSLVNTNMNGALHQHVEMRCAIRRGNLQPITDTHTYIRANLYQSIFDQWRKV